MSGIPKMSFPNVSKERIFKMWDNWVYIAIPLMILVLIGMLVVKKTMASSPMLQPMLFLCVALELGLVISVFYKQLSGGGSSGALNALIGIP